MLKDEDRVERGGEDVFKNKHGICEEQESGRDAR